MKTNKHIPLENLCIHYKIKKNFIYQLNEIGLIELVTIEQTQYIHHNKLADIEKILRLRRELKVNLEGIDIIFQLLQKIEAKNNELSVLKNKLRLYKNHTDDF